MSEFIDEKGAQNEQATTSVPGAQEPIQAAYQPVTTGVQPGASTTTDSTGTSVDTSAKNSEIPVQRMDNQSVSESYVQSTDKQAGAVVPAGPNTVDGGTTVVPNVENGHTATSLAAAEPQKYVIMPGGGLPALAAELWSKDVNDQEKHLKHIDDLYELNRDLLPNALSFQAGQVVRIPEPEL